MITKTASSATLHAPRVRRFLLTLAVSIVMLLTTVTFGITSSQALPKAPNTSPRAAATAMLKLMNRERSWHHLRPLTMNSRLVSSAYQHNLRMARVNFLSHQLPGEASLADRITAVGYRWSTAGENIAWNYDQTLAGVLGVQRKMYGEKPPGEIGHRDNILSTQFTNVGISVVFDKAHLTMWVTQDFGRP